MRHRKTWQERRVWLGMGTALMLSRPAANRPFEIPPPAAASDLWLVAILAILVLAGTVVILTIMLVVYFVLDGIFEVVAGLKRRPGSGWGWMLFGGIVSILLGAVIWSQFPLSGIWAIGILLGIKLFFVGLIMLKGGSAVRSMAKG